MSTNLFDPASAIGYYRVSTQRQEEEGHGAERYLARLESLGIKKVDIYFDVESGGKLDRPELQKALSRLGEPGKKFFVIPYYSRLSRDVGVWDFIRKALLHDQVELIELDKGLSPRDIVTASGTLQTNLDAAFAQYQRDQAREHSVKGHAFRRAQNRIQQPCFGYKKGSDGKMQINDDPFPGGKGRTYRQVAVEMIDTLVEIGGYRATIQTICSRYGETHPDRKGAGKNFPRSTKGFMRWVQSPLLRGYLVDFPGKSDELIRPGEHEPIMDPGRWGAVQATIKHISSVPRAINKKGRTRRPLAGKILCGMCGGRLNRCSANPRGTKDYAYLICRGGSQSSNPSRFRRVCPYTNSIRAEDFMNEVIAQVCDRAHEIAEHFAEPVVEINPEIGKLETDVATLQAMEDPLVNPAIAAKQKRLAELRQAEIKQADQADMSIYELVASDPQFWEELEPWELRVILDTLIRQVVVGKKGLPPEEQVKVEFAV